MKVSKQITELCRIYAVPAEVVYYAILIAGGATKQESYYIAFRPNTHSAAVISNKATQLYIEYPNVIKLIDSLKANNNNSNENRPGPGKKENKKDKKNNEEVEENALKTKEGVLNELINIAKSLPQGSTDKAKVLIQIADLQQMKRDQETKEDDTIRYYLPVNCAKCSLYKEHKEKQSKNQ